MNAEDEKAEKRRIPERPERDVLLFLLEHAPLEPWQADVLSIIRDEAYYFAPQAQTKIMNEGWASYWHSTIMTRHGVTAADIINYADHHTGTMASSPTQLNPYKLGIELFRDIEDRWNRGAFGNEYDECDDDGERRRWNKQLGLGREKIFEVRRIHNDLTFIDEFLTLDFCREHKLFRFGYNPTQRSVRDREPRVPQGQAATAAEPDQPRPADHLGRRRQLQEPRRAVSEARLHRRRAAARRRRRHAQEPRTAVEPARAHRDGARRRTRRCCRSTAPDHDMQKGEAVEAAELEEIPS